MFSSTDVWSRRDLEFIVRELVPEADDGERMIDTLRDDPEMLEGMLEDERLFRRLTENPEEFLNISGRLFFSVLLNRTRFDLHNQTFTFEKDNRYSVVVFDSAEVLKFLDDHYVRAYLADMLTSFVRIENRMLYVRQQHGVFRKVRVNDFDIESLIEFSRLAEGEQRLYTYKRIGDICLFLLGVFSDYIEVQRLLPGAWFRSKSKRELAECGTYYYRAALNGNARPPAGIEHALQRLSREFPLAVKPLTYVSSRYLGFIRRTVFLQ